MPVTINLRRCAVTLTLALAATSATGMVAVPAYAAAASNPCASIYRTYEADRDMAAAYYDVYKHSSGQARAKAYALYLGYRDKSQNDLKAYNTCLHNH